MQGGDVPSLREVSARELSAMPFEGFSVGGLAVGEPQAVMLQMIDVVDPILPRDKPRYLMGVGTPDDIIESVCARHRPVRLRDADAAPAAMASPTPASASSTSRMPVTLTIPGRSTPTSNCPAARDYSRAYIHHLVRTGEALGAMLLTWVNVAYYQSLMQGIRDAIEAGRFEAFKAETKAAWARGETE